MKQTLLLVMLAITGALFAKDASLAVDPAESNKVTVNNKTVTFDGEFKEIAGKQLMAFGEKVYSFPAKGLIGQSGSIALEFALPSAMQQSKSAARTLAVIRANGREEIGFYTFSKNPVLQYRFSNGRNNFYGGTKKLKPNTVYRAVFTWNGDRIRCYLDGKLIREAAQPYKVIPAKMESVNIGPFSDRWYRVHPWPNDTFIKSLRVYKRPLSGAEIAALSGVKSVPVHKRYGRTLTASPRSVGGSSYIQLQNLRRPFKSWDLPVNNASFSYDSKNLYVDFNTIFPAKTTILKGFSATDPEAGVWGVESFELHLRHSGKTYYFGGTVNGGRCDVLEKNSKYNPEWSYKSHIGMQIDDTFLWEGKIVLPWKALQLTAPPKALKLNFCRSFFNSAVTAATDLACDIGNKKGYWGRDEFFYDLKFDKTAPALKVISRGNPSFGNLEQEFEIVSPVNQSVNFTIIQESSAGLLQPQNLFDKKIKLTANMPQKIKISAPLTMLQADKLVYRLTSADGKKVYSSQDVPLQISAEYLTVKPLFYANKVNASVKTAILRSKFGANAKFTLSVKNPAGKVIYKTGKITDSTVIPFKKDAVPGNYTVQLTDGKGNLISGQSFLFPGYGKWSKFKVDESRIVPPYTAMKYNKKNGFTAQVVLRDYTWKSDSLLPEQITSKGDKLFTAAPALFIDGREVRGSFKNTSAKKHRAEIVSTASGKNFKVVSNGWLEYDGVQHNQIKITALKNISNVELRFTLPAKFAKYLHTSAIGWSNKITRALAPGKFEFKYFPVVFIGNEEKGFCFFAESDRAWNSSSKPMIIVKNGKEAVFTVKIARNIKAGKTIEFDCGLLGAPVKPQHKRYPLNTASWAWNAQMNRPGKTPTSWCSYMNHSGTLADAFADVPGVDNDTLIKDQQKAVALLKANNVKPFNYNPFYVSDEHPEMRAFGVEWESVPRQVWTGQRKNKTHTLYLLCPASKGADFFLWRVKEYLKKVKVNGINFDFGIVPSCDNNHHGCFTRTPLIAYRNFYRKLALILLDSGADDYIIHVHNTSSVQLPSYTFVTHVMNGEHIRQQSSRLMHNGKDILDTYPLAMFACELSSLPFGINNAVYQSNDVLTKQYGGGKEDPELYKLRITRAFLSGTLLHNTINALNRCHHGIFDKIVRIYDKFNVPEAEFIGYWDERKAAQVTQGKDVLVSFYRHKKDNRILAVISHIGNIRRNQDVTVKFNPAVLKMKNFKSATELLEGPDPEYQELYALKKKANLPTVRIQLKWQNPGIKLESFKNNTLKLHLPAHSFALVEIK